jgi:adenylate cyclase
MFEKKLINTDMKYLTSIWTTIFLGITLLGVRIADPQLLEQFRLSIFDQYIQSLPVEHSNDIVLINISESSLEAYGQYPWPRQNHAAVISDLRNANAGIIGFTIMFPEEDRFSGDTIFASWIKDNGIILAQDADQNGRSSKAPYVGYATFGYSGDPLDLTYRYKGLITNIEELEKHAWGVGLLNGAPEVDNLTRRIPLMSQVNGELYPSFALETVRAMQDKKSYTIKLNEAGIESIVLRPFIIPTDERGSIWLKWNTHFESIDYDGQPLPDLKGKTAIIGVTAKGIVPQVSTPAGLLYPHQIQANALQTIISDSPISRPQWTFLAELSMILVGSLLIVLSVYYLPIWSGIVFFVGSAVAVCYAVYYAWYEFSILLDLSASLIIYILLLTSASFNNFYKQFVLRQQIKKQFGTYVSPDLVKQLQKDPSLLKLGGERKNMTFMFMDICGFTPISEHYKNNDDPEGLVILINNYLDTMTKIVLKNGGTIDKFMGDCIMAFWNAPLPCDDHADKAVQTSLEICDAADILIKELEEQGLPRIDIGIGINTGDCIVGNMGSEERFDYSVIGDAVNLGARLEGQTRNYDGVRVLLGEETYRQCPSRKFTEVDRITVKGKSELITVYTPQ